MTKRSSFCLATRDVIVTPFTRVFNFVTVG